jgi:hypothetical protein
MKPSLTKRRGAKAKRRGASTGRIHGRDNLVADIVDQITRKHSKEAKGGAKRRAVAGTCSFCLEPSVASSPYRVVLKCNTGEAPRSGH